MPVLKSFHTSIKYNYHAQDEWNEVQKHDAILKHKPTKNMNT